MIKISRRNIIKLGAGLIAFLPAAQSLLGGVSVSYAQAQSGQEQNFTLGTGTLGGIALGADTSTVLAKLGKPKQIRKAHGNGSQEWEHDGIIERFLRTSSGKLGIGQVSLLTASAGSTAEGIQVASSITKLKQIYGDSLTDNGPGGFILTLPTNARLVFEHNNISVTAIVLQDIGCDNCKSVSAGSNTRKK